MSRPDGLDILNRIRKGGENTEGELIESVDESGERAERAEERADKEEQREAKSQSKAWDTVKSFGGRAGRAGGTIWHEGVKPAGRYVGGKLSSGADRMYGVATAGVGGAIGFGWTNLFIFLSIVLYASDLGTRFDGIDIDKFSSSFLSFDWQMILANGVVLVILISYYLINMSHIDRRDFISFAILVELFSLIFFLGGFTFGVLHIIFAIFLYIFLIRPTAQDMPAANYTLFVLLAFDFFGYGLLDYFFPGILSNRLIIPVWFYYTLLLTNQTQKGYLTKAVIILVVLLNVAVFAYGINQTYNIGKPLTSEDYRTAITYGQTGLQGIKKMATGLWTQVTKGYTNMLNEATGGYYESEVEENEKEPLGVYLENIEPADSEYFEKEPVTIWATLKARTLDKPVGIQVNCSAKEVQGKVTPQHNFTIQAIDEEDISCRFDELDKGSNTITLSAKFNFETMAYLKSYFMHQEKLNALKRQNIDVFNEYGITDRDPISKCTNGPVNLGIGTKAPPIGILKEGEGVNVMPKLGVTITNIWEGEITEIKRLIIQVPDSFVIEPGSCDREFVESNLVESGFNIYELKNPHDNKLKNITEHVTFNCRLQLRDPSRLLGDTPLSIKYFRASADYIYSAKKTITLDIKETKFAEGSYMGADSEARPKKGCYGKDETTCRGTELCFVSYEKGTFKECKECATDKRDCSLINKENFCPNDVTICENYCTQDPCYHYCKWTWTNQAKGLGNCVNKDIIEIRKELAWPLAKGNNIITKCYENKKDDKYYGIAISAKEGDTVSAADKGIILVNNDDLNDNHAIEIWHYPGFKTRYQNLKLEEKDIATLKWKPIKKGDKIGVVGNYKAKETDEIYLNFVTLENNLKVNPLIGALEIKGYYQPENKDLDLKFKTASNCCQSGNDMYTTCKAPGREVS